MVSIMKRVAALPQDTLLYCGHEYALHFLENAAKLDESLMPRLQV